MMARAAIEYHWPPGRLALLEEGNSTWVWLTFYRCLMWTQLGIFTFWCLMSCAQSVSGERERKTWDFQRTTLLTPGELLAGKLLGEPALVYFIVLCCFPVALLGGLEGGIKFGSIVSAYILLIAAGLALGLVGLWLSSLFESRSRGMGLIGSLGLYLILALLVNLRESPFPGLAGLCPLTEWTRWLGYAPANYRAYVFGIAVPWLLMSLALYLSFGAWFVVMLLRNLKRDYADMSALSRWQTVGCAAFLNSMIYALFQPSAWGGQLDSYEFVSFVIAVNAAFLFALGLATLTSYDRLKEWSRGRSEAGFLSSIFSENGPPWPWLGLSAIAAYLLLALGLFCWKGAVPLQPGVFARAAAEFLVLVLFVTSNILFIQWCRLTRMRAPLLKGFLYLCLYYSAALVVGMVLSVDSETVAHFFWNAFTPKFAFRTPYSGHDSGLSILISIGLQVAAIYGLLIMIEAKLKSPAKSETPRLAHELSS